MESEQTELLRKVARLEAQVAALAGEQVPRVERASKRRDRRQVIGGFGMFAIAILLAGTMSASALAGTNTVDSGDIINGQVKAADLANNVVTSAKILDGQVLNPDLGGSSVTSAKVKDGTLTRADLDPALYESLTAGAGKSVTIWEGTLGGATTTPVLDVSSFTVVRVSQYGAPGFCSWAIKKKINGVAEPDGPTLESVNGTTKLIQNPGGKMFIVSGDAGCPAVPGSVEGFR